MQVISRVQMRESLRIHVVNFTILVRCNDYVMLNESKMCRNIQERVVSGVISVLKSLPIPCFPSERGASNTAQTRRSLLLH